MKKVRRKLPQVPPDEETNTSPKHKQRPIPAKKPILRTDNRVLSMSGTSTSASDDSSMNEDDKEVASITRKKHINDLDKPSVDKPSVDKCNGNYINSNEICKLDNYRPDDMTKVNIPPEICYSNNKHADNSGKENYLFDTDALIDAMINIYGAPITQAMKGLKKRLQEELRRVTEGRRKKIDEIEELRALKFQLGELKIGTSNKATASGAAANGKKRSSSNSRTSPQMINRRARHKRQSSDPMVAKFSPIKEDKDIESEIQIITFDDNRSCRTGDDSSQSGVSDTDSTRSEPTSGHPHICRKVKPTDYAKIFYSVHAQSSETLDKRICVHACPELISCHSEGNLPNNVVDEETRQREEKRRELQFEIEKRKRQLAEREYKLKEARTCIGVANKQLTQSCDEISAPKNMPSYVHPRPIPTGIIKPIDDDSDTLPKKANYQHEANYSSTEYLAHKQEEFMKQRYENFTSFSSPFLYSADFGERSAFVPQQRTNLDSYSYSTGNVNVGKDKVICSSATLPNIPISKADLENNNRHTMSDTDSSPPSELTPAMPLLTDVKAKSRKIIHEIGSGSRPVSAEFNVGVEDLMNGMYRVESDNSVDADEPIMKHLLEGGVTILKQLERKKQPPPSMPKKYDFPVKRILLTTDPKEKYIKGRQGNGVGMKIIGGKTISGRHDVGAYVAVIYKGGVADRLRGEVKEGDQILEWNGIDLTGKSYEEVQQIISQAPNGEVELVIRPSHISRKALGDPTAQAQSCHSSYDNLESDEDSDSKQASPMTQKGIDPQHLQATLEEIEEDESPCMSQSSSQQDYNTASASSGCSSPLSEPTSTSSDQQKLNRKTIKTSTGSAPLGNSDACQKKPLPKSLNTAKIRYGSQGHLQTTPPEQASKIPPSSSDFFRRPHTYEMLQRSRQHSVMLDVSSPLHSDTTKKIKHAVEIGISEKSEIKKNERLQQQQSNSFDDFLRMSHHAGIDDRQLSPSKTSRKPSKRGLSASAMDLGKQKCSESEEDIKKSPKGVCRGKRQMGDIQLKLKHDAHKNEFRVRVIQARNLLPMDLNGLSDPFVKIYLLPGRCSDNKRRTKHVPKTLNPEWNETIVFPNVHIEELRNKTLEVTVWDYDRFKANDFLGEVVIDFSEDSFLDNLPHWYPLCDHDDPKGLDIPQPTVLPPRHNRANSVSPITMDRPEQSTQSGSIKSDRPRPGMGRRRRSFDALKDVDKV